MDHVVTIWCGSYFVYADTNSYLTGKDTSYPTTQYYGSPIRGYSVEIQKYLYNKLQWVKEYLHVLRRKKTKKK